MDRVKVFQLSNKREFGGVMSGKWLLENSQHVFKTLEDKGISAIIVTYEKTRYYFELVKLDE